MMSRAKQQQYLTLLVVALAVHLSASNAVKASLSLKATWVRYPSIGPPGVCFGSMAPLGSSGLLIYGGNNADSYPLNTPWLVNVSNDAPTARMLTVSHLNPANRTATTMAAHPLRSDWVVMYGGYGIGYNYYLDDTWIFDGQTLQWIQVCCCGFFFAIVICRLLSG